MNDATRHLGWKRESRLTLRRATSADRAVAGELAAFGTAWDLPIAPFEDPERVVVELDDVVVAIAATAEAHLSFDWQPEPLRADAEALRFEAGIPNATIACGLVFHASVNADQRRWVHRLTRTLHAAEAGHRYCVATIPLPTVLPYDCAATVQQITHGGVEWEPLEVPLRDGYWPIAIDPVSDAVVCVRRDMTFAEQRTQKSPLR